MHMYVEIIREPRTGWPLLSSLVARMPESMVSVALVLLVRSATGSYARAGLAGAGLALGSVLAAPVAGRALDRLGQRPVLVATTLGFAGALVAVVVTGGRLAPAAMTALALATGAARPPLDSAMRALWPQLVAAERLQSAYAIDATLQ